MNENIENAVGTLLEFKWTTSRAADTYGYNICTLWNVHTGKRLASCKGGGYDMEGTSFGDWVEKQFQSELLALANSSKVDRYNRDTKDWERVPTDNQYRGSGADYYGLTAYTKGGKIVEVKLDGGCGMESIRRIFNALGLEIRYIRNTKNTKLYEVKRHTAKESEAAKRS